MFHKKLRSILQFVSFFTSMNLMWWRVWGIHQMFQTSTMKIGCNMRNLTRHVCKKKPSMGQMIKSDVFWPFFEGSKIENFVFSIDNVLPNLLNTPYVDYNLITSYNNRHLQFYRCFCSRLLLLVQQQWLKKEAPTATIWKRNAHGYNLNTMSATNYLSDARG